jgi:D-arabinose 1-dehydrogenase-like Zn-dependent alcohol dehydrogenase
MKSFQIVEFGKPLELRSYEVPQLKGTEVLVKVAACGVCHSDLHLWSGYYDLGGGKRITLADRGATLPFTMGHESAGEIVATGPEADRSAIGRRGVVFPWIGCGHCDKCRRGHELMCENSRTIGTRKDGGYSDYVVVPDAKYIVDYGTLDASTAAIAACSGLTAYSAIKKLPELEKEDAIVVIGAGGVGLTAIGLLSQLTPARVVAVDIASSKRAAAVSAGAAAAVDAARDDIGQAVKAACNETPRAVLDFVGTDKTASLAMSLVGRGGQVVIIGLFGGEITLSVSSLAMRNIVLQGSNVGTLEELRELLGIMNKSAIKNIPITVRPMSEVNEILHDLHEGRTVGRTVMVPGA